MTPHPPGEEIQDLVDGRLASARRADVEAHVAECARCRQTLGTLSWARQAASLLPVHEPPPELATQMTRALDRERGPGLRSTRGLRWIGWAFGLGTAAAIAILFFIHRSPADLPAAVARSYSAYLNADLRPDTVTGDGPALEAFFTRRGIAFATRVFDLDMMGYRLLGGRIQALGHGPSALVMYQDRSGRPLLCQMYEGTLAQLPTGGQREEHNGIEFRVFRSGPLTLVFWQEGAVVCVLASSAPVGEVMQLAYAKAVKV